jgi:hypothetical protein
MAAFLGYDESGDHLWRWEGIAIFAHAFDVEG